LIQRGAEEQGAMPNGHVTSVSISATEKRMLTSWKKDGGIFKPSGCKMVVKSAYFPDYVDFN
jgi:hypothetical protein